MPSSDHPGALTPAREQTSIDPVALASSLSSLRARGRGSTLSDALDRVIDATRQLFSASGAGIMLRDENSALAAVAATDEPGRRLEQAQERIGEGPCVDSLTFDRIVTTPDLVCDDRWPVLTRELADGTVRAVLGVPLHADKVPIGSLNVYRDRPRTWDHTEVAALEAYAELTEGLLISSVRAQDHERLADQLQHALDHRVVIERAVGVIMGRENINAVVAFNRLRTQARNTERKVADVAAEILAAIPGNAP